MNKYKITFSIHGKTRTVTVSVECGSTTLFMQITPEQINDVAKELK